MALDMDPHILNFYEDMDLPITDIPILIDHALSGQLINPLEKLDGQNFTFTVDDQKKVRFMGKGCPKWIRVVGGLSREEMIEHYSDKVQVQKAFTGAYDALARVVASCDQKTISELFENGNTVVAAEVVTPINPNIVRYKKNAVCLLGIHSMGKKLGPTNAPESFKRFQNAAQSVGTADGWTIMGVPNAVFKPHKNAPILAQMLKAEFESLLPKGSQNLTMGDVITAYVEKDLIRKGIPLLGVSLHRAARRLAYDDPSIMKSDEFPGNSWKAFKPIDDERAMFVGEAIIPIEAFFRKLGAYAIESHEFTLADVDDNERITELKTFISRIKFALRDGRVRATTPEILKRIESASKRVDETLFTKNVEGIVFSWRGQLKKLTGAFTAVNRLHGYFAFENAAQIIE